jgi:ABC-type multidrug transport system ATPase subunit/ABC-type nitrate/sulfonate/bicarbonate transport system permease component
MTEHEQNYCLKIQGLCAGYKGMRLLTSHVTHVIINNLNFEFRAGYIYGILGPNASGKSTLLRAIVDPKSRFSGEVFSNGQLLTSRQVGYMPQSSASTLSPWQMGVTEAALHLRANGERKDAWKSYVTNLASKLGFGVPLDRKVGSLSGGQRVKVALLRSLAVSDLRVFVADEPFEGLDTESRKMLAIQIRAVAEQGIPVIITSHRSDDLAMLGAHLLKLDGSPVNALTEITPSSQSVEIKTTDHFQEPADAYSNAAKAETPVGLRSIWMTIALGVLGVFLGVILWSLLAVIVNNKGLLPAPWNVFRQMLYLLFSAELRPHFSATILRAFSAWLLANLMAIPLGVLLGYDIRVFRALAPWLSIGRTMPIFALVAPAAGLFPMLPEIQREFLIWLTLFLISLQAISATAALAPRRRVDVARIFGASRWFILTRVMFFESIAGIFAALEVTLPLSIVLAFVIETFLIPDKGLGIYLFNHLNDPDMSLFFAHLLVPAILGALGLSTIRFFARNYRYDL